MAYDPQNPLDAITGERAKRGKKNQTSRPGDFVGPPTPRKLVGQSKDPNIEMFDVPLVGPTRPEPFVGPPRKMTENIFSGISTSMNKRPQSESAAELSRASVGQMQNMMNLGVNTPRVPMQPGYRRPELPSFQVPQPPQSIQDSPFVGPPTPTLGQRFFGGQTPQLKFGDVQGQGAGAGLRQTVGKPQLPSAPSQIQGQPSVNPMRYGDVQGQGVQLGLRSAIGESRIPGAQPPLRGQVSPSGPGSSPGLMTRSVQQPELGQVGVNAPTSIPPYLSNDRAALAAMERMRPQTSQRPQQATPSAAQPAVQSSAATPAMAQPEQAMVGPERQPNRARIDQLRAQIASEQQAMLAARRARGGSFREDAAPLERIAGMRQELAQYERAATPGQTIRVKTPEENLATEQSLARQASDIMARDLGADNIPAVSGQPLRGSAEDLRRQVATMPAGPERDAMAEQLRSLQYQQQQQAARAGALPAGAVGPQPMGASVELAEQMMGEARARTERQREAAPRVAARQQELADVAMREGERLTGKRQDVEQQRADFARATREATLAELSAPERARKEAFASEQSKREIAASQSQAEIAKTNALTESIIAKTGIDKEVAKIEAERARAGLNQILSAEPDVKDQRKTALEIQKTDLEIQKLERDALALKIEQQRKADSGLPQTEEDFRKEQVIQEGLMRRAGVTPESEALVRNGLQALGQRVSSWSINGKMAYASPADATEDIQHVNQFLNYESKLNTLYNSGPEGRRMAQLKARDLLASIPSDFGGYRPSVSGTLGAGAGGAAAGAAVGAAIGSVVPIAGTAIGAAIGAGIGAIAAGLTYDSFASDEESAQVVNKFNAAYASLSKMAGE